MIRIDCSLLVSMGRILFQKTTRQKSDGEEKDGKEGGGIKKGYECQAFRCSGVLVSMCSRHDTSVSSNCVNGSNLHRAHGPSSPVLTRFGAVYVKKDASAYPLQKKKGRIMVQGVNFVLVLPLPVLNQPRWPMCCKPA